MSEFLSYFTMPFVRYAFICGILISAAASLLGTTLVLKRFSFLGDGLSHIAFGALAIATVLRISNSLAVVLPLTVLAAILLLGLGNRSNSKKISGDAAIALFSVSSLAIGYMLLNIFPSSSGNVAGDVCSTLFGSTLILTLSQTDVILSLVLSCLTVLFFVLFYNKIFAVTFDESFAKATGMHTGAIGIFLATIIAVVIVLAMNLVGSLLISALIIFPCITAMRIFKSFKSVTICAVILAVCSSFLGIMAALLLDTPVGASIVTLQTILFAIFCVLGKVLRRQ